MNIQLHQDCIEACWRCLTACQHCVMRCTAEKDIAVLARCIALSMECSTICSMLAQLMSMESFYAKKLLSICAEICSNCATECYQHKNIHCPACAKACEACAIACNKLLT